MTSCLLIKNDGIGDLILASGLIASIAEHFGGQVDLITCDENREVAEGIVPLRERIYVSRDDLHFSARAWRLGVLWPRASGRDAAVLETLRGRRYDVAISLRRFIRQSSLVIMRAARANKKLCAWQFPTNAPVDMAARASEGWQHLTGPHDLLSELAYATRFAENGLGVPLHSSPRLSFCRMQAPMPGHRTVGLGIGGSSANWPVGSWVGLAQLLTDAGWQLALFGGPNVRELAELIGSKVPTAQNHVGALSLAATARRIEECDAFIGNDTGITHLASLVARKCLVISGGGTFRRFFPWPDAANQTVVFHGLECFDCDWSCRFNERYCLSLVPATSVFGAFETMMTSEQTGPREINLNVCNGTYDLAWKRTGGGTRARFEQLTRVTR